MNPTHLTPKPAPPAAHTHGKPAHAGQAHGASGINEASQHSHSAHSYSAHHHAGHVHPVAALAKATLPTLSGATPISSVLGWPAWLRVLAVLPVLVVLWLAVAWASAEVAPW